MERVLTPSECARRRQRCLALVYDRYHPDLIAAARAADRYWERRVESYERELDTLAALTPTLDQYDSALRGYHAALCRLGRWAMES
jgi:hypothetical protein